MRVEMPCSVNDYSEATGIMGESLINAYSDALNIYRLSVEAERSKICHQVIELAWMHGSHP